MTMYLPNRDIRPIGVEPAEFIEAPAVVPVPDSRPEVRDVDDEDDETRER